MRQQAMEALLEAFEKAVFTKNWSALEQLRTKSQILRDRSASSASVEREAVNGGLS
jgi:hypothetical protein